MGRTLLPEAVEAYVAQSTVRIKDVQRRLRDETARLPQGGMQIGPDQGALFALLVHLIGAKRALEIGTFTGYSALAVALALPDDGQLVCCDVSEEWTSIGRRYWAEAGVAHKIDLRLAPATRTLDALVGEGRAGTFDFAFIDADKPGYDAYYEGCLKLVRANGLIALDNVLWDGKVADPSVDDDNTRALRVITKKIVDDPRVEAVLLTVGDGVMLVRKK